MAAQVERDSVVVAREFIDLLLPGMPELGKAVHEEDQRAVAGVDVVQADAVEIDVVVLEVHATTRRLPSSLGTTS